MIIPQSGWAHAELDPLDLGAVPQETLEAWIRAVPTMDRDTLDALVRHAWRAWSAVSLGPLGAVVAARRAQLDGE